MEYIQIANITVQMYDMEEDVVEKSVFLNHYKRKYYASSTTRQT